MPGRLLAMLFVVFWAVPAIADDQSPDNDVPQIEPRAPKDDDDLKYWLTNLIGFHRFSIEESAAATGLTVAEIESACERFELDPTRPAEWEASDRLHMLPYPGGRHPRIGFLEGAIRPQRETKVSVFTPWQPEDRSHADYVVVDVPEAIWSNLGLTYLAHTHVPTIWTLQGVELEPLEWNRAADGILDLSRELPNGITFTSRVVPRTDHVFMEMTLTNGTDATLRDLRVQNCVMLKGAEGFQQQTNENKHIDGPTIACHDESGRRWIITAWRPTHRAWGNERCPCLHSDPQFEDCPPGETRTIRGRLWFYEGTDIDAEIDRVEATAWWQPDDETPDR